MSCKNRCLKYLKNHSGVWVASGKMQRLAQQNSTYTGSTVSRDLRKLAEDKEIEVKYIKGHAHYRVSKTDNGHCLKWFDEL